MDFWFAIVMIVLVGSMTGVLKSYFDHKKGGEVSEKALSELQMRIDAQDERIKNLETIIFELEKERRFDTLNN